MKTQRRRICNKLITLLFVGVTLLAANPVQAAPSQLSIKRPDLVLTKDGSALVHVVKVVNRGTAPAGTFLIRVERFNGSANHYWIDGLAVGEVRYVNTFFRAEEEEELVIIADATKMVIELNEENNHLCWGIGTRVDW